MIKKIVGIFGGEAGIFESSKDTRGADFWRIVWAFFIADGYAGWCLAKQ
ncbi:hypothetical protein [Bartonella sp. AD13SXNS]